MTCPALVPIALCAALGEPSATALPTVVAAAPQITSPVGLRRYHHYRARAYRAPRARRVVIVREPAVTACPPLEPAPRLVQTETILAPAWFVRVGFEALQQ